MDIKKGDLKTIHSRLQAQTGIDIKLSFLSPNVMKGVYLFITGKSLVSDKNKHHNGLYLQYPNHILKQRILLNKQIIGEHPKTVLLHEWTHAIICNGKNPTQRHTKQFKSLFDKLYKMY